MRILTPLLMNSEKEGLWANEGGTRALISCLVVSENRIGKEEVTQEVTRAKAAGDGSTYLSCCANGRAFWVAMLLVVW
ncbi:MAG: hypothetical protein QOE61_6623 [Micromonosporaceae bacterium]|nr:hypothetical protein [Micromonosporaceae bacterium]